MAKSCPVDIAELRNIVSLCAFASEAQRVLLEVDHVCGVYQKVDETLSRTIEARNQWSEIKFSISSVLDSVSQQMETLDDWIQEGGES